MNSSTTRIVSPKSARASVVLLAAVAALQATGAFAITGSLTTTKIDTLQGMGLTGAGINVGQIESYQPDSTNPIFTGVTINLRNNPDLLNDKHSTMVAGIMVGKLIDTTIPAEKGIAPGATLYSSPWVFTPASMSNTITSLDSAANYMGQPPVSRVINMSAGDILSTTIPRIPNLSRVIDYYAARSSTGGRTSQLYVIAETNDGWDDTAITAATPNGAPLVNSVGNPDSNYNGITVGALGGLAGDRTGTTDYKRLAGFSGQGLDTDNFFNPDIVAPGGQIRSSVANWDNADGVNGDLKDDNHDGFTQIDLKVVIPLFGLRDGQLGFVGGGTKGTIKDKNGNGVFDIADLVLAGAGKNFNDNDGDGTISPGDTFIRTAAADAGDDPDPAVATANGTSFAAPHVTGATALLMQKAQAVANLNGALDHRVMKAILMNTTDKLIVDKEGKNWLQSPAYANNRIVTDDQLGAGSLDAAQAYKNLVAGRYAGTTQQDLGDGTLPTVPDTGWDLNALDKNTSLYYHLPVLQAGSFLAATLCWDIGVTRNASDDFAYGDLADFDLYLYEGLSIGSPGTLLLNLSSISSNNNEELIFALLPATDFYTLRVEYHDGVGDPNVGYGLAWLSNAVVPEPTSLLFLVTPALLLTRRRRAA